MIRIQKQYQASQEMRELLLVIQRFAIRGAGDSSRSACWFDRDFSEIVHEIVAKFLYWRYKDPIPLHMLSRTEIVPNNADEELLTPGIVTELYRNLRTDVSSDVSFTSHADRRLPSRFRDSALDRCFIINRYRHGHLRSSFSRECNLAGVALSKDENVLLVVCRAEHCVKMYEVLNSLSKESSENDECVLVYRGSSSCFMSYPSDIVVTNHGSLDDDGSIVYVTDSVQNSILIMKLRTSIFELKCIASYNMGHNSSTTLLYPCGIAARDEFIYVCDYGNGRLVTLRRRTGDDKKSESLDFLCAYEVSDDPSSDLYSPWGVACTDDGKIFLTEPHNNAVIVLKHVSYVSSSIVIHRLLFHGISGGRLFPQVFQNPTAISVLDTGRKVILLVASFSKQRHSIGFFEVEDSVQCLGYCGSWYGDVSKDRKNDGSALGPNNFYGGICIGSFSSKQILMFFADSKKNSLGIFSVRGKYFKRFVS